MPRNDAQSCQGAWRARLIDRCMIYSRVSRFIYAISPFEWQAVMPRVYWVDSRSDQCKSWIQTLARADYILLRFVEFSGLAYSFMRLSTVAASWTINGNCWVNNLLYKWCFSAQKFVSYVQTIHLCFMLGHRLILENALCVRICEAWCSDTDCWTMFHYFQENEYATGI